MRGPDVRSLDGVRIVFSDMDDTFLHTDKSTVARNMALLDRLGEKGVEFVPCTGRSLSAIPPEVLDHPAVHYAVPADGSCVYTIPDGDLVMDATVGKALALELYGLLADLPITFDVFADGRIYSERRRYEIIGELGIPAEHREFMRSVRTPVDITAPEVIEGAAVVERLGMFWRDDEEGLVAGRRVCEVIDAHPGLRRTGSTACGVEVLAAGTSKGSALAWLCDCLGIPVADSVAFGDSPNDVEMLRIAGDGVAVANAWPEALAAADHVTTSNDDGGVAAYFGL